MPLEVRIGSASRAGQPPNSDRCNLATPEGDPRRARGVVLSVSDAAGKDPRDGELAEALARGVARAWYASPDTWSPRRGLEAVFADLNRVARKDHPGRVATLTVAVLCGRTLHLAHVGDCRAWLVREGVARLLTQDHSWNHPDLRAALHRAMGLDEEVKADLLSEELAPGDLVVLASDGVHKLLDPSVRLASSSASEDLDAACERLLDEVFAQGGKDDATLAVCRVEGLPSPEESLAPLLDVALPPFPSPSEGLEVDGFRLVQRVAKGRCSQVWLAFDQIGERKVVLKIPDPRLAANPESALEFAREEWIGRRVKHPSIVPVLPLAAGRRTCLYFAMPWIPGSSLRRILHEGAALDAFQARRMFLELYPGLLELHRQGVLHRDIKPDNILRDELGRHLLADLGVAKIESMDTRTGNSPGTPSYMAPELFEGAEASERSEVFAMGATLYECLTRRLPYGEIEPFTRPRFGAPPPPSRWNPEIPQWLERIVLKAIDPDPESRFQSMSELAFHMERQEMSSVPVVPRADEGTVRRRLAFWAALATAAALLEAILLFSRSR